MRRDRRRVLAADWCDETDGDRPENAFFDASFSLAEAARDLNQATGRRGASPATAASLGCATSGLKLHGEAVERMRGLALYELACRDGGRGVSDAELDRLDELLKELGKELRAASETADLARATAARILDRTSHR